MELILSRFQKELLSFWNGKPQSQNLTKEEWQAMCYLAEDRLIIIKSVDEDLDIVI